MNFLKINTKNLSSIASDVSDQVYNLTPKVQNELIVRDKLSSMAVAGTYNLINRILPGETMSKIQTPPLGDTPMPKKMVSNTQQINPQTGMTRTESALLSPKEQVIARRT